ncbi:MAG: DUF4199 domain-containing protein [Muribaculaceae bacterium]|nr:DUF4199 domain-containing protein [Muribaculaceae bacterium]
MSIYRYAAHAGIPVGIYLSIISACLLFSLKVPFLPLLIFPLLIGFPFLLGYLMERIARERPEYRRVATLWLGGIYAVIFGTLICTLLSALYIKFVDPGFVYSYISNAIATIESSPMAADYSSTVDLMRQAIEAHLLPNGMEFVSSLAWSTCFCGSLLSLFLACILARRKRELEVNS